MGGGTEAVWQHIKVKIPHEGDLGLTWHPSAVSGYNEPGMNSSDLI